MKIPEDTAKEGLFSDGGVGIVRILDSLDDLNTYFGEVLLLDACYITLDQRLYALEADGPRVRTR